MFAKIETKHYQMFGYFVKQDLDKGKIYVTKIVRKVSYFR